MILSSLFKFKKNLEKIILVETTASMLCIKYFFINNGLKLVFNLILLQINNYLITILSC